MSETPAIEIIARGLCLEDDRVLLCRSARKGYHYLPGGHVEFGEPAAVALAREFMEETGQHVSVGPPLLVEEHIFTADRAHHEINIVFHVERAETGPVRTAEPQIAFDWIPLAAIPETDIRPESVKAWLAAGGGVSRGTPTPAWLSETGGGPD